MSARSTVLAAIMALLPAMAAAQTAPRQPGNTFFSLTQSVYNSTDFWNGSGIREPNGCNFFQSATVLYLEHGFDTRDTGSVRFEYDHLACGASTQNGLNDTTLAWLHEMRHSDTTSFSWRAEAIVPGGYNIGASPRIGYGRFGGQFGAVYEGSFRSEGGYGFYSIESSLRGYFGYPAPQLRTFGQIGEDISPRVQLIGQVEWNQALGAGHALTNVGLNPLIFPSYSDAQTWAILRIKVAPHLSLVGSTSYVFWGRNYGIGSTSAIGFWGDF
jgi:hypothetical protein